MAGGVRDIHLSRNALLALVTVIGLVVIAVLVYFLISSGQDDEQPPEQAEQTVAPPNRPPLRQPGENARNTEPEQQFPSTGPAQTQAVTDAARSFTDEWLRTDRSQRAWLAGIEPYGTEGFNRQRDTDSPDDVPATSRTGEPSETEAGGGYSTVDVPLDSGTLTLEFRYIEGAWLIASYDFELRAP